VADGIWPTPLLNLQKQVTVKMLVLIKTRVVIDEQGNLRNRPTKVNFKKYEYKLNRKIISTD